MNLKETQGAVDMMISYGITRVRFRIDKFFDGGSVAYWAHNLLDLTVMIVMELFIDFRLDYYATFHGYSTVLYTQ